jgi:type VI secretion system protein ImpK
MTDDDPFAEPGDTEKTVIRPNPLGRVPRPWAAAPGTAAPAEGPRPDAAPPAPPAGQPDAAAGDLVLTGLNPLNACAAALFALVSRVSNRAQHLDPDRLRASVVAEVRAFERRALQAGIDPQTVKVARYAICATIDDVVLNTPWGGQSSWTQQTLVGAFHKETVGGDRFYDLLARLEREPGKNVDLLEFLYMCLSLGFEGRLRVEPNGAEKHLQIRAGLARVIAAQRGAVERGLSPRWKGVERAHRPLSAWLAIWVTLGALAAVLALGFFGLSWALGGATNRLLGQMTALDSGVVAELQRRAPPPPPPPPSEAQLEVVRGFLEAEIAEGLVTVLDNANTITIRITGEGMFGSGSDALQPAFEAPLARVAAALDGQPGPVIIAGHSDSVPIQTARFPSNMHLSLARAESVMRGIAPELQAPERLTAEGRADAEPIAPNDTAEGRARNRRIEVILVKEGLG